MSSKSVNDHYLSDNQIEGFKETLREELLSHRAWIDSKREELNQTKTVYVDPVDQASEQEDFDAMKRELDRRKKRAEEISSVLRHFDKEEFGYCQSCGIEIGRERLAINPAFKNCTECANVLEIKAKQFIKQ